MNALKNGTLSKQFPTPHFLTEPCAGTVAADAHAKGIRINTIPVSRPSEPPADVTKFIGWLACHFGSEITVLHAIPSGSSTTRPPEFQAEISIVTGFGSAQVRAIIVRQGVKDISPIISAARDEHADLIVIPANYYKQSVHFWQAGRMEELIHQAHCPVLIVDDKSMPSVELRGSQCVSKR